MYWPPDVHDKLAVMLGDTPMQYKRYTADAKAVAELQARKAGRTEIDEESMIRGFIISVPRHLRDGIEEVLTNHNIDLMYYRPALDEANYPNHLRTHPAPSSASPVQS